ncbi:hypothetical protein [uncultured Bacteroides sp.]|uniref:hypothetical protein n=1 Tax=uncultured Bacteroides sp. TaxID=162156 RepID=UPI0025CDED4A|nr:hypothetical protein [uncultured Bacteroides sp.]
MKQDLFFKGEIPALESDKEGKLRGGFCALGGGSVSFYSDNGCSDSGCGHTNEKCSNTCGSGSSATNNPCTNTCAPNSSDNNIGCHNNCGTTDNGCSHGTDTQCTTPVDGQKGIGLSFFNLGSSTLF